MPFEVLLPGTYDIKVSISLQILSVKLDVRVHDPNNVQIYPSP